MAAPSTHGLSLYRALHPALAAKKGRYIQHDRAVTEAINLTEETHFNCSDLPHSLFQSLSKASLACSDAKEVSIYMILETEEVTSSSWLYVSPYCFCKLRFGV